MSDQPTLAWIKTTETQEGIQIVWDWEEVEPVGTLTLNPGEKLWIIGWGGPVIDLPPGEYLIVPRVSPDHTTSTPMSEDGR